MANTIYAAFEDKAAAEKAAGALLDHGVAAEDITLVSHADKDTWRQRQATSQTMRGTYDSGNDAIDMGDSAIAGTKSIGNRVAGLGDRAAGGIADALGAEDTAAGYRAAAERRDELADTHAARSGSEFQESLDMDDTSNVSNVSPESNTGVNRVSLDYDSDDVLRDVTTDLEDVNYNRDTPTGGMEDIEEDEDDDADLSAKTGLSTTTGADAASGAVKGAAVGLGVGALGALAAMFVPPFGIVAGSGALATALAGVAGATAAGAAAGGLTGYLKDQGVDEDAAMAYGETVNAGGAMLAVHLPSGDCDEGEARAIIAKYGGSSVNSYQHRAAA
jgi:hypothetical protein